MSVVGMEVRKVVLGLMGVVITVVFEDYSWHFWFILIILFIK